MFLCSSFFIPPFLLFASIFSVYFPSPLFLHFFYFLYNSTPSVFLVSVLPLSSLFNIRFNIRASLPPFSSVSSFSLLFSSVLVASSFLFLCSPSCIYFSASLSLWLHPFLFYLNLILTLFQSPKLCKFYTTNTNSQFLIIIIPYLNPVWVVIPLYPAILFFLIFFLFLLPILFYPTSFF